MSQTQAGDVTEWVVRHQGGMSHQHTADVIFIHIGVLFRHYWPVIAILSVKF